MLSETTTAWSSRIEGRSSTPLVITMLRADNVTGYKKKKYF
jgi:hypothetical protein